MQTKVSKDDIATIVEARMRAPHEFLGRHASADPDHIVIRAFLPHAEQAFVASGEASAAPRKMRRIHADGLFEAVLPGSAGQGEYALVTVDAQEERRRFHDPYAFTASFITPGDGELFRQGEHLTLFDRLGARPCASDGVPGVSFAVWAPHAQRVSVVGTFNRWDGRCHQMRLVPATGVWELFIPDIGEGELYKYEIRAESGDVFLKVDPFAQCAEAPPNSAAIVYDLDSYIWQDQSWRERTPSASAPEHLSVGLLEPSQWQDSDDTPPNYRTLAPALIAEAKERGRTHLAIPRSGDCPSYFAPDPRWGTPHDFMALVDACHGAGIGVLVDWIPARFPSEFIEMTWYDGSRLYEREITPGGAELAFASERHEVASFLLSNAVFWLQHYHADGLRVDSATLGLYLHQRNQHPDQLGSVLLLVNPDLSQATLPAHDVNALLGARHKDPHAVLGAHPLPGGGQSILRAFIPRSEQVYAHHHAEPGVFHQMGRIHQEGLFATTIAAELTPSSYHYRVVASDGHGYDQRDAYACRSSLLSDLDRHLFAEGNHYHIYRRLGAHPTVVDTTPGVNFAVWAPNATGVSVVGDFNAWDGRCHPMRLIGASGIWELFIPSLGAGTIYKYELRAGDGLPFLKSDPYAFHTEVPPSSASIVYSLENCYQWQDESWLRQRAEARSWESPLAIYEVHLGSWRRGEDNRPLSYAELSDTLIPYVKDMGFTHIELLPIAEHPYEPSWGYQVSNFFAPTSRFGDPAGLMAFVDACHQQGIGVILDWVPGHFPKDAHALASFDGTALFEHADPRKGEHRDWGTLIFNYGRHEVENFLISNALFWLETYHFDGLRVDAVASMLYLDYSRPEYDWIPNVYGGREDLEAIEFLRHTNSVVHAKVPGVMMIAEESTAWPGVSRSTDQGGLGFGFKWNMGWMHDVLSYMSTDPIARRYHHKKITFGIHYAFHENFILSLSHDEVVHLKQSLLNKMPGDEQHKFANLRLLFLFMYTHPGKKLLFMGGEFGQPAEWDHARALQWGLLDSPLHRGLQLFVQDLNRLYRQEQALHQVDFTGHGFEWLDVNSADENVIAFARKAKDPRNGLVVVLNFSAVDYDGYRVGVPYPVAHQELIHSDAARYGGSDGQVGPQPLWAEEITRHGQAFSLVLNLPALSGLVLQPQPPELP